MLSRIAESLFWIGRYLERAEDTARLLDVQIHQLLEGSAVADASAASTLLSVMGVETATAGTVDLGEVTALLAFSSAQPSSIVSSLRGRAKARGIRESISSELWECLNATIVTLDARVASAEAIGPHEFFRFALYVRERVALAVGIADATMSRDDGWRFLVAGKSIERADMTARLLAARTNNVRASSDWVTTLRSCSAYEAYLRTYRGAINASNAIEFLVLDRFFPRSVYFSIATAESSLAELEQHRSRNAVPTEARRVMGQARAALEFLTTEALVHDLAAHLHTAQRACSDVTALIATHYFQREQTLAWRRDGTPEHVGGGLD